MKKHGINIGSNTLMVIITFVIGFGIVTVFAGGSTMGLFTSSLERDANLTGRTDIWAAVIPFVMEQPILGCGFGGFWTPSTIKQLEVTELHNGYLELIMELGFVGMLLFWIFMLSCCRKAIKILDHDFDWGCLCICFLLMTVLSNITETSLNSLANNLMAVLLLLTCSAKTAVYATGEFNETQKIQYNIFKTQIRDKGGKR